MRRSIYTAFVAGILAMAAIAAAVAWGAVRECVRYARSWLQDIIPISIKQPKPKCRAARVQPKAFMTRLEKRQRPTVTARWRMCPST